VQRYQGVAILNAPSLSVVPGASITVYLRDTQTKANLYAERFGTVSLGNPFSADYYGEFYFYAPDGAYDIKISNGLVSRTIQDVILFDPISSPPLTSDSKFFYKDGSRDLENSQPTINFLDDGLDGRRIRIRSELGFLKLQINVGDESDKRWVTVFSARVLDYDQVDWKIPGLYSLILDAFDKLSSENVIYSGSFSISEGNRSFSVTLESSCNFYIPIAVASWNAGAAYLTAYSSSGFSMAFPTAAPPGGGTARVVAIRR
jgi:hypothetical protein